jgi:hypothetical protein
MHPGQTVRRLVLSWCGSYIFEFFEPICQTYHYFSAVFLLLGVIVYSTAVADDQDFDGNDLNAGFALTICAAALLLVAGVIVCFLAS